MQKSGLRKKVTSLLGIGIMTMGLLAGCGSGNTGAASTASGSSESTGASSSSVSSTSSVASEASSSQTQESSGASEITEAVSDSSSAEYTSSEAEASSAEAGKTLVVYYSATDTTEGVAQTIAQVTGADIFEIEPVTPYSSEDLNWNDDNSRVSVEHNNEDQRNVELVSVTVDNWDSYDTVYIGYPIWWGIAAWPVNGFVEDNDFTGKTVIPFCTSASSGIGESGSLLYEMTGTGNWLAGERISRDASEQEIQEWISSLGL